MFPTHAVFVTLLFLHKLNSGAVFSSSSKDCPHLRLGLTSTFCLQCPNLFCLWLQSSERLKEDGLCRHEPDNLWWFLTFLNKSLKASFKTRLKKKPKLNKNSPWCDVTFCCVWHVCNVKIIWATLASFSASGSQSSVKKKKKGTMFLLFVCYFFSWLYNCIIMHLIYKWFYIFEVGYNSMHT